MEASQKPAITVTATINAPVDRVWNCWTDPAKIIQWNYASDDWHCPQSTNDLRVGGRFTCRMEAKDGSMGFDFGGVYDKVVPLQYIEYTLDDGRKVSVRFESSGSNTRVEETFEAESLNPPEMQKSGWQAILDHFKRYAESNSK